MYVPAFFGLLLAAFVTGQHVEITPREAVRRVNDDLEVLCKVSYPIDSCRFTVGGIPYRLLPNNQDGDVVYHGQGLQLGECGAHIRRINADWNGNVTCTVPPPSGSRELTASMRLLVARAPAPPRLLSPERPVFREGEQLEAQCVVPDGRPAAKLTWFLDDEQLLVGFHQPVVTSSAGDLLTISQNLTRALTADDSERRLVCRAEHEALDAPRDAARQLIVQYPPRRIDGEGSGNQLTIFGLKLGAEGRLNVTVRANPAPRAQWTASETRLSAPATSDDGRLTALQPMPLGNGSYNVSLVLTPVTKEDVERTYFLALSNDLGGSDVILRISTMDEPAGVELDAGAIVGIVVAVLVLLAAVTLIVFAKATDRWCFGGGRARDLAKSSGESDTESAVGGRGARGGVRGGAADAAGERFAAIKTRVLNAWPRGRDRVQASEAPNEEDKPSEEKKGVVYAELALGEVRGGAGDKPPPPPAAAEYAEIVYSEQGHKEAKE